MAPAAPIGIGTSIVLIAVGAILKYAVEFSISGLDINTVGTILLLVGILGLVIAIVYTLILTNRSRGAVVDDRREVVREREYRDEPPTRRRF